MSRARAVAMQALLALVVIAGAAAVAVSANVGGAGAAGIYCDTTSETRQPVLLVHGYNSGPATWSDASRNQLSRAGSATCIDVFDYQAYNDRWATNEYLGPALAARIDTLAAASKAGGGSGKVIVVAHSNGGLVTRCAASAECNGGRADVASHLLELISFGTPNLGSWLVDPASKALGDLLSAACTYKVGYGTSVCKEIRTVGTSEATRGFTPGSQQLRDLPQLPSSVPVYALAGKVEIHSSFFGLNDVDDGDAGDVIVLEDSATAAARKIGALGGQQVIDCGSIDITDWLRSAHSCTHITETNDTRFLEAAAHQISLSEQTLGATRRVSIAPVDVYGNVTAGWTVHSTAEQSFGCDASPSSVTADVFFCGPTASSATACWPSSTSLKLLCTSGESTHDLYRQTLTDDGLDGGEGMLSPADAPTRPVPLSLDLANGNRCWLRTGGSWGTPVTHPDWVGSYYCKTGAVWASRATPDGIDTSNPTWTVYVGGETGALSKVGVRTATYVAMGGLGDAPSCPTPARLSPTIARKHGAHIGGIVCVGDWAAGHYNIGENEGPGLWHFVNGEWTEIDRDTECDNPRFPALLKSNAVCLGS